METRLDDAAKEKLRTLLVEMLLEWRILYLRTSGANTLEHWRILLDRMQIAAKTSGNADEWATSVTRRLQIHQLGNSASSTFLALSAWIRERDAWRETRVLLDRERGLLEALGRKCVDEDKAARAAAKTAEKESERWTMVRARDEERGQKLTDAEFPDWQRSIDGRAAYRLMFGHYPEETTP